MQIARFRFLSIILSFLLLATVQTNVSAEQGNLDNIKRKINKIRSQLSSEQSKKNQVFVQLKQSEKRILDIQRNISKIHDERKAIADRIHGFEDKELQLIEKKRNHQRTLKQQLRAAYKAGKESKLKLLLSQKEPEKIGRLLNYHSFLNVAREKKINALQDTIEEIKGLRNQIKDEVWKLSLKEEALEREQQSLLRENNVRQNLLSQINSNINVKNRNLKQLIADRRKLSKLITKVDRKTENNKPIDASDFASSKGILRWPIRGQVRKYFGSRITSDLKYEGILIKAEPGNSVRAIHSGKVVFADWFQNKGLMVIVNHGNGYMSLYAHNKSLLNKVGDKVYAGEKIAVSGNSGNVQIAGLYFEIRKDSAPLNPLNWLKK